MLFGEAAQLPREVLAGYGVTDAYVVEPGRLSGYAPLAWARVLAGLIAQTGASAVVAAATDRGNEVMAHLGALAGQPMAANCVSAGRAGAGSYRIVRQRWAGLLLEDAVLEAPVALLTVATDAVPATPAAGPATLAVHVYEPELAEGDLLVRASESAGQSGGISPPSPRGAGGRGRGVGRGGWVAPLGGLAGVLGGVVGVDGEVTREGCAPRPPQGGPAGTKITPELYLACGISGAIQHIAGCASAKHIVAVNKDAGAPILAHAEYAVIGDLHEVIPALVSAIRDRGTPAP